jgi:hypothetical protein
MEQTTILTPLKVRLLDNLRYFDSDDSEFTISAKEVKELPAKHLRSYSIKLFLFSGRFRVVEGEILFTYKSSLVYLSSKGLWGKEIGKYYVKDMEFDSITFIEESKVPADVFSKLNGNEPNLVQKTEPLVVPPKIIQPVVAAPKIIQPIVAPKVEIKAPAKEAHKIESMTKNELLEFAKKKGFLVEHSLHVNELRNEIKELMKSF